MPLTDDRCVLSFLLSRLEQLQPLKRQAFTADTGAATKADRRGQWESNVYNTTYIEMCSVV